MALPPFIRYGTFTRGHARPADPDQATWPPDHHQHHQHAKQQHAVLGEAAQQLRRNGQHERGNHHAHRGAHAAQHHDGQDQCRLEEGERGRVDEALVTGKLASRHAFKPPDIEKTRV